MITMYILHLCSYCSLAFVLMLCIKELMTLSDNGHCNFSHLRAALRRAQGWS